MEQEKSNEISFPKSRIASFQLYEDLQKSKCLSVWSKNLRVRGNLSVWPLRLVKLLTSRISWLLHELLGQFMNKFTSRMDQHSTSVLASSAALKKSKRFSSRAPQKGKPAEGTMGEWERCKGAVHISKRGGSAAWTKVSRVMLLLYHHLSIS
jgi:hypothetical protein